MPVLSPPKLQTAVTSRRQLKALNELPAANYHPKDLSPSSGGDNSLCLLRCFERPRAAVEVIHGSHEAAHPAEEGSFLVN